MKSVYAIGDTIMYQTNNKPAQGTIDAIRTIIRTSAKDNYYTIEYEVSSSKDGHFGKGVLVNAYDIIRRVE